MPTSLAYTRLRFHAACVNITDRIGRFLLRPELSGFKWTVIIIRSLCSQEKLTYWTSHGCSCGRSLKTPEPDVRDSISRCTRALTIAAAHAVERAHVTWEDGILHHTTNLPPANKLNQLYQWRQFRSRFNDSDKRRRHRPRSTYTQQPISDFYKKALVISRTEMEKPNRLQK